MATRRPVRNNEITSRRFRQKSNLKTAFSLQEVSLQSVSGTITLLASFAAVVSYSYHVTIALRTGYPIVLISPDPWDFLSGLLQSLPLLLSLPFCFKVAYPAYCTLRSQAERHTRRTFLAAAIPIGISFALLLSSMVLMVLLILIHKTMIPVFSESAPIAEGEFLVIGAAISLLVTISAQFISLKIGASTIRRSFISMLVSVVSATGRMLLVAVVITFPGVFGMSEAQSRFVALAIVLFVIMIWLALSAPKKDSTPSRFSDSFKTACLGVRSMGGLGKLLVTVALAALVGLTSASVESSNEVTVHRYPSGETIENDSGEDEEKEEYRLLDVFGGNRAVVDRKGENDEKHEYRVISLEDGFWISS